MNFFLRSLAGYLLVIALSAYFGYSIFLGELKPGVRQSVEELLVDNANLFAELFTADVIAGRIQDGNLSQAIQRYHQRSFNAQIYGVPKTKPDLHVYATDAKGIVIFDSTGKDVGQDYSRWNDVNRTLQGVYGARATRSDPDNPVTSAMYVAAPIRIDGRLAGVLTVGKASSSFEPFIDRSRRKIVEAGAVLAVAAFMIALFFSWWMGRSLHRLSEYAREVSSGVRIAPPRFRRGELRELAEALERMREELAGKAHVEKFAQMLTHELKSPLAAIQGAVELLREQPPPEVQQNFLANVQSETARMQQIIERILNLAVIEHRSGLQGTAPVRLAALLDEIVAARTVEIARRQLLIENRVAPSLAPVGEKFLLQQALANLVDNAIAFSPHGGRIQFEAQVDANGCEVRVCDAGNGIPDYAQSRLFERFFSLPRPDTGKKSTGLGLTLVKEVMELHRGSIEVKNAFGGGVVAALRWPQ